MDRRELDFKTFDAMGTDADRLAATGYMRASVWDLSRVCDHLSRYMRMSITSFPSKSSWYARLIARKIELPVVLARGRLKPGRAALASLQPLQPAAEADAVAAFRSICTAVQNFTGDFAEHPRFGRLTPDQWRQLHLIHGAHHLSFLIPKKPERKSPIAKR